MTSIDRADEPLTIARAALSASVASLLTEDEYDDLGWLPTDFGDQLMEIAWQHRADIDGAQFKRALKTYINSIAPVKGQMS